MDKTEPKTETNIPNGLSSELLAAIKHEWTGFDKFKMEYTNRAKKHFGSGWLWLIIQREGNLEIADGHDAENPLSHGQYGILTIDVWYVMKYRTHHKKNVYT